MEAVLEVVMMGISKIWTSMSYQVKVYKNWPGQFCPNITAARKA